MILNLLKSIIDQNSKSTWKLVYDRLLPSQEGLREALCTLGNGYFATRGAATESRASETHYPGTYFAGVYNKLPTKISGRNIYNEDLVNCPNWQRLSFRMGAGEWINPSVCKLLSYYQELDMRQGILIRKYRVCDYKGRKNLSSSQRNVGRGCFATASLVHQGQSRSVSASDSENTATFDHTFHYPKPSLFVGTELGNVLLTTVSRKQVSDPTPIDNDFQMRDLRRDDAYELMGGRRNGIRGGLQIGPDLGIRFTIDTAVGSRAPPGGCDVLK